MVAWIFLALLTWGSVQVSEAVFQRRAGGGLEGDHQSEVQPPPPLLTTHVQKKKEKKEKKKNKSPLFSPPFALATCSNRRGRARRGPAPPRPPSPDPQPAPSPRAWSATTAGARAGWRCIWQSTRRPTRSRRCIPTRTHPPAWERPTPMAYQTTEPS